MRFYGQNQVTIRIDIEQKLTVSTVSLEVVSPSLTGLSVILSESLSHTEKNP